MSQRYHDRTAQKIARRVVLLVLLRLTFFGVVFFGPPALFFSALRWLALP